MGVWLSWTGPYLRAFRFSLVVPQAGFIEAFCWISLGDTCVTGLEPPSGRLAPVLRTPCDFLMQGTPLSLARCGDRSSAQTPTEPGLSRVE